MRRSYVPRHVNDTTPPPPPRRRRRRRPRRRRRHRAAAGPARPRRACSSTAAIFPADTISTHQLARTGVVQLHRWGLLDATCWPAARRPSARSASPPRASRSRRTVKDTAGVDLLVAPRRYVLDTILAEAAAAAGAELRSGVTRHRRPPRRRTAGSSACTATTAPARRSRSTPGSSSAPTGWRRGWPARSAPQVIEDRGRRRRGAVRLLRRRCRGTASS